MRIAWFAALLGTVAAGDSGVAPPGRPDCSRRSSLSVEEIVGCLRADGALSAEGAVVATAVISDARRIADSLRTAGPYEDLLRSKFIIRSLQHVSDIYDQGMMRDSARLNRLLDHVAVSADFVRGRLQTDERGLYLSNRTPDIPWVYLPNVGIYPDLSAAVVRVLGFGPVNLDASLPELRQSGEAIWAYAVPMRRSTGAFPVWELYHPGSVCAIQLPPPRQSAATQGAAIRLFAELARRTGDPQWAERGEAALAALRQPWEAGGVRVDVAGHSWWEEADPRVRVWRTAAATAIAVWDLADAGADEAVRALALDGIAAVRAEAARFDDGIWTRYCASGGYQDGDNHRQLIALADALQKRTADPFWAELAGRWRSLSPPPPVRARRGRAVSRRLTVIPGGDGPLNCAPRLDRPAADVVRCARAAGILSEPALAGALAVIDRGERVADSLTNAMSGADDQYWRSTWIRGALGALAEFQMRGALRDSARIGRLIDVISVNTDHALGRLPQIGERIFPPRTPHLTWVFYPGSGVYFQPVTTIENAIGIPLPDPAVSTDTLLQIGDAMWEYAVERTGPYGKFPVWEYNFHFLSDVQKRAPWVSGLAQGEALKLYTELFRRTGDVRQAQRARLVFRSFRTRWSDGGVLVDDTTHGYWWEEYDPRMMTWNGSMAALVAVGLYAEASGSPDAARIAKRGREAARYWTPFFDTGEWTTYSLLAGYVSAEYQRWHIMLLDALFQQTGDAYWRTTADRWRSYTPPSGLISPPALNGRQRR